MQKPVVVPKKSVAKNECCHYWIIESPRGPTSKGVCKFCGAEKEFINYVPYWWGEDDISMPSGRYSSLDAKPEKEPDRL